MITFFRRSVEMVAGVLLMGVLVVALLNVEDTMLKALACAVFLGAVYTAVSVAVKKESVAFPVFVLICVYPITVTAAVISLMATATVFFTPPVTPQALSALLGVFTTLAAISAAMISISYSVIQWAQNIAPGVKS